MLKANLRIENVEIGTTEPVHAETQEHHDWFEELQSLFARKILHDNLLSDGPAAVENEIIAKVERLLRVEQNSVNEKNKQEL